MAEKPVVPAHDAAARGRQLLDDLRARFAIFDKFLPLRIGVHREIYAALPDRMKTDIRRALAMHTGTSRYLRALAAGGPRYSLDGTENGIVPDEHKERAKRILADRKRKPPKPEPAPPPPPPPPPAIGRPILRLKKKPGPVVTATVVKRVAP